MGKYLVVAHQTAASPELIARLQQLERDSPGSEFVLLVPATPVRHLLTWEEGNARQVAQERAMEAKNALRAAGINVVDARIGGADAFRAMLVEVLMERPPFDAVVISTFPAGLSRWLRQDLPSRARRRLDVPVVHVVAASGQTAGAPASSASRQAEAAPAAFEERDWDLRDLGERRGEKLYAADGSLLGRMREVIFDYQSMKPVWVGVSAGPAGVRTLLLPARAVVPEGDHLRTHYRKAEVLSQPHVDMGEGFDSLSDERAIYAYFGLPLDEKRDFRVLRAGQPYPGAHAYAGAP